MAVITLPTQYYRQFDANPELSVPAEGYGGWATARLPLDTAHTALVVMHAWDCGEETQFPGWYRAVEYIPRQNQICKDIMPGLLAVARESGFPLLHVVGGGSYYAGCPGYRRALALTPPETKLKQARPCETHQALQRFHSQCSTPGAHNEADIAQGFRRLGFAPGTEPLGDEGVSENAEQLYALCEEAGINHLIYTGFALNWCLLMSPGGMVDMSRRGFLCSAISEAVTAVENHESAKEELHKREALWRVGVGFGYVYALNDFKAALQEQNG